MKRLISTAAGLTIMAVLGLTACSPNEPQVDREPQVVEVTLTEFGIESSTTTFEAGQPYRFVVTNTGVINHEFVITRPLEEEEIEASADEHGMDDSMEDALLTIAEDDLPPGTVVTVEYTFTQEASTGELEMACHVAGHYTAGMHRPITVEG